MIWLVDMVTWHDFLNCDWLSLVPGWKPGFIIKGRKDWQTVIILLIVNQLTALLWFDYLPFVQLVASPESWIQPYILHHVILLVMWRNWDTWLYCLTTWQPNQPVNDHDSSVWPNFIMYVQGHCQCILASL